MTTVGLSATRLVQRAAIVTVGKTQIKNIGSSRPSSTAQPQPTGLDFWFQVRRSLKPGEPNTCDLRLYNLSDTTRKAIEAGSGMQVNDKGQVVVGQQSAPTSPIVPVRIEAGYIGATDTVFLGFLRSGQTVADGPDTVTELQTGDGDAAVVVARSTKAFGAGANAYVVAQQLLKDMGVGPGNLATVASVLKASPLYQRGVVLRGSSYEILLDLAASCGLEVTLQQGVAQFLQRGQPLGGRAYALSSDAGLVGHPSIDTKGVLTFKMLMAPGIRPGLPIVMNAKYVQGTFRITAVETTGDTAGGAWYHDVEAKSYGRAP